MDTLYLLSFIPARLYTSVEPSLRGQGELDFNLPLGRLSMTEIVVALIAGLSLVAGNWVLNRSKERKAEEERRAARAIQEEIRHEVKPNSGKSIKDRTEQMHAMMLEDRAERKLAEAKMEGELKALNQRLEFQGQVLGNHDRYNDTVAQALVALGNRIHDSQHPQKGQAE